MAFRNGIVLALLLLAGTAHANAGSKLDRWNWPTNTFRWIEINGVLQDDWVRSGYDRIKFKLYDGDGKLLAGTVCAVSPPDMRGTRSKSHARSW